MLLLHYYISFRCCKKKKRKHDALVSKYKLDHENFLKGMAVNTVDGKLQNGHVTTHKPTTHSHTKSSAVITRRAVPKKCSNKAQSIDNGHLYSLDAMHGHRQHLKGYQRHHMANVHQHHDSASLVMLYPYKYVDEKGHHYVLMDPSSKTQSVPNVKSRSRSLDVNMKSDCHGEKGSNTMKLYSHREQEKKGSYANHLVYSPTPVSHSTHDYLPNMGYVAVATSPRKVPPGRVDYPDTRSVMSGTTTLGSREFQEIAVFMRSDHSVGKRKSETSNRQVGTATNHVQTKMIGTASTNYVTKTYVSTHTGTKEDAIPNGTAMVSIIASITP